MDGAADIPTPGRPLRVLGELVYQCQADVFGHAESSFKRVLHGAGRELPGLERAGNAWRFSHSRSRGRSRNVFSGAASFWFAFTWRPPHAFQARLPRLGNGGNVRRLVARAVGMVGELLAAWL